MTIPIGANVTQRGGASAAQDVNTQANEAAATILSGGFADPVNDTVAMYKWIIAWIFIVLIFMLMNRTKLGHVLVYYSLLLLLAFTLVTQYQWVNDLLSPLFPQNQHNNI